MNENLKKRLDRIEETSMPARRMVICCYPGDDLDELIAVWKAEGGVPSPDKPLIVIRLFGPTISVTTLKKGILI